MAKQEKLGRVAARGSRFFLWTAVLIALLVPLSFSMTNFTPLATATRQFTLLHHLHGLASFAWIGLYLGQVLLVRRGKVRLHRELGLAGIALGGAMVPLG